MAKKALIVLVLTALLLSLVPAGAACLGGGGGSSYAIDMMNRVPKDTMYFFSVDVGAVREHESLKESDHLDPPFFDGWEEYLGIDADDIGVYAIAEPIWLLSGVSDPSEVSDSLEAYGYERADRDDVELWRPPEQEGSGSEIEKGWYIEWIVLTDGVVAFSSTDLSLEGYLAVMNGQADTMYDAEDYRRVMDRLPDDTEVYHLTRESMSAETDEYEGLELVGISLGVIDNDTAGATAVFAFESGDAAQATVADIQDLWESEEDARNVRITQDSELVIVTAEGPLEWL